MKDSASNRLSGQQKTEAIARFRPDARRVFEQAFTLSLLKNIERPETAPADDQFDAYDRAFFVAYNYQLMVPERSFDYRD